MIPLFIQPRNTCAHLQNDPQVNIPLNICLVQNIVKREIPFTSLKASNKIYVIDFNGVGVSWHFETPEDRDSVVEKLLTHDFSSFQKDTVF